MSNSKRRFKLAECEKAFVVQRLACFDTPGEVAAALRDEFGKGLRPQSVEAYDPTKRAGRNLSTRWRRLFERTRQSFLEEIEKHLPEANKAVRIGYLCHAARAYKGKGNYVAMADMLERIAKEMGNVHTNRREISGRDGKPIEFGDLTNEQLDQRLEGLLRVMGLTLDEASQAVDKGSDDGSGDLH